MSKTSLYRDQLASLAEWDDFLRAESGLPGPRGNLELAQAAADLGERALFERYLRLDALQAPVNSPDEFLAFCGAVGLGRLAAEGQVELLPRLREVAADPRWRMREAAAMALQRVGEADMDVLIATAGEWAGGDRLEQRAAAAGLAEPRLLRHAEHAGPVLDIFDRVTASLVGAVDSKTEAFRVLRQALGYAWSVVAAAYPQPGLERMERWMRVDDPHVRWVMRENLKKNRLARLDAGWVERWRGVVG